MVERAFKPGRGPEEDKQQAWMDCTQEPNLSPRPPRGIHGTKHLPGQEQGSIFRAEGRTPVLKVAPVHFRAWASGVGRPHGEALGLQGCLLAGAGNVGSSTESETLTKGLGQVRVILGG